MPITVTATDPADAIDGCNAARITPNTDVSITCTVTAARFRTGGIRALTRTATRWGIRHTLTRKPGTLTTRRATLTLTGRWADIRPYLRYAARLTRNPAAG